MNLKEIPIGDLFMFKNYICPNCRSKVFIKIQDHPNSFYYFSICCYNCKFKLMCLQNIEQLQEVKYILI